MKKIFALPLVVVLSIFSSCQKQQTDAERQAEIDRQVQQRLDAEHQAQEKEKLAQREDDLNAREKAFAEKQNTVAETSERESRPPRTERPTRTEEQQPTASYDTFYTQLDRYGDWRETSDYGYVWQPRQAQSRTWRPYTDGHWVYSDAGWTWVSEEPFGWATYHYGRWVRLRRIGWVWVPGDEWAPAWVSWRTNRDYVGWAPLPPEARFDRRSGIQNWADSYYDIGPDQYSFVSSNEFGAEHVRRVVVPQERNINIVIETTNVTRITFSNTTIINEGPSYDELRSRSQRPIECYRLRRERNTEVEARISGGELQVSVPVLGEVRNIFRPRRVKERVMEMNVDNGWASVSDRSAAERARTKIRTEATPPPNAPPKTFVKPEEATTATASATPAATAATTSSAATPTPTAATRTNPSPSSTPATSPTPAPSAAAATPTATAAATPSATAAAAASATASASPRTRPRFSPSATPAATTSSPTPAAPATTPATSGTATS